MNNYTEGFITNGDVRIHYLRVNSNSISNSNNIPIIVVPGMIESAEDYLPTFKLNPFNRTIYILSIRGRGKSDAPEFGYTLDDQSSDIEALYIEKNISTAHILGISTGTAFALNFTICNRNKVSSLILCDFPPHYPQYSNNWAERISTLSSSLAPIALNGIVREAKKVMLVDKLANIASIPTLIIKGERDGSLLPEKVIEIYEHNINKCYVARLTNFGHNVFFPKPKECLNTINIWLEENKS